MYKNKSIAIVVPEMLPVPAIKGGAIEHWVEESSKYLVDLYLNLTVVSRPSGITNNGDEGIQFVGVPWRPLEKWCYRFKEKTSRKNPLRHIAKIQNVYSYSKRVAEIVKGFDLIVVHNEPNILLFIQKQPNQKLILHMHNEHLGIKAFRCLYKRALLKVDKIICVSDYIRRKAVEAFPEYADKFCVVFNSTDPEVFKPYGKISLGELKGLVEFKADCKYLLYVGRLTPLKGVHILIKAFAKVLQKNPSLRLIITGSSFFEGASITPYEEHLIDIATPVKDKIIFTGFLPHEKLKFLYSQVNAIVLPSIWQDPCPLVVLEAMSSGTCLIASRVGGIPEVVENDVNGILVAPDNDNELAMAIIGLLSDESKMTKIANAAREKIQSGYTWKRLTNDLVKAFESTL